MKTIETNTYLDLKSATFEGQVLTPETEDEFADDILEDNRRKRENNIRPIRVPSFYKARRPSIVAPVSRDDYSIQDDAVKRKRIEKTLEKQRRMDSDYNDISSPKMLEIMREISRWEKKNKRKMPPNLVRFLKDKYIRKYPPIDIFKTPEEKKRKLVQLNTKDKVAYTLNKKEMYNHGEEEKVEEEIILDFLEYINNQIIDFAKLKNINPEYLKDFLGLG